MERDERKKQVAAGLAVLAGVAGLIILIAYARFLPGLGGEFFGRILGIITTPFLMETSFCILGFVLVMTINNWRQRRDGDELVHLDEIQNAPGPFYPDATPETGPVESAVPREGGLAITPLEGSADKVPRQLESL